MVQACPAFFNQSTWNRRLSGDQYLEPTTNDLIRQHEFRQRQRAEMIFTQFELKATSFARIALFHGGSYLAPGSFLMRWFLAHGTSMADQAAAILEAIWTLVDEFDWELARELGHGWVPDPGDLVALARAAVLVLLGGLFQRPGLWLSGGVYDWTRFLEDVVLCLFRRMCAEAAEDMGLILGGCRGHSLGLDTEDGLAAINQRTPHARRPADERIGMVMFSRRLSSARECSIQSCFEERFRKVTQWISS